MKKILLFLGALVSLFVIALFVAGYKADAIIAKVKPQIEQSLSDSLKTKVALGEIHTRIFPETILEVDSVTIGEPGKSQVVTLNNATLKASLLPLLGGTIAIHEFSLRQPDVTIDLNVNKVISQTTPKTHASEGKEASANSESPSIEMRLDRLSIEKGRVTIKGATPSDIVIEEINLSSNASLIGQTAHLRDFRIHANTFGQPLKVAADAIEFDLAKMEIIPTNLSFDGFDGIAQIKGSLQPNKASHLDVGLDNFSIEKLLAVGKSLLPVLAPLSVQGSFGGTSKVTLEDSRTNVATAVRANFFGGSGETQADVTIEPNGKKLSLQDIKLTGISIADALRGLAPALPVKLFGFIETITGDVTTDPAAFIDRVQGTIHFSIKDGGIKDINIVGATIKRLFSIPIVGQQLAASIPPGVLPLIDSPDTTFSTFRGNVAIQNKGAAIQNTVLDAEPYTVTMNGNYNLSGAMKINATVILKPALTAALVAAAKDFSKAVNADGTLTIPVIIQGNPGEKPLVIPDITALSKTLAGKVLVEAASKALEKGLGKNGALLKGLQKLF